MHVSISEYANARGGKRRFDCDCMWADASVDCFIPDYDLPEQELDPVLASHLSSMCTENWAKSWAVNSKESAGDIANAVIAQCDVHYRSEAHAIWPIETWPIGTVSQELPDMRRVWRAEALKQVIETRV